MAEPQKPNSSPGDGMTDEVAALRLALACVIEALPAFQRKRIAANMLALTAGSANPQQAAPETVSRAVRAILDHVERVEDTNKRLRPYTDGKLAPASGG
jgi:hypothetical protein